MVHYWYATTSAEIAETETVPRDAPGRTEDDPLRKEIPPHGTLQFLLEAAFRRRERERGRHREATQEQKKAEQAFWGESLPFVHEGSYKKQVHL